MTRVSELHETVERLARLRDDGGIVSLTFGLEPGAGTGGAPAADIFVANELKRLRSSASLSREQRARLGEVEQRAGEILDPKLSGRGRALFVALETGEVTELSLQRPLTSHAGLAPVAHVLPLVAALGEGGPAGLVSATRDLLTVQESELDRVRAAGTIELEPTIGDWWPVMKGPTRPNPAHAQQSFSQRDRYERRLESAYRHELGEALDALGALAEEHAWTAAVLAGDPRLTGPLAKALETHGVETRAVDANLEGLRPPDATERLRAELAALFEEQSTARARETLEAVGTGAGACGLQATLEALAERRVAALLIDPERAYPGAVDENETLTASDADGSAVDLADWIVAHAIASGASVTAVSGDAAEALDGCGGIAVLLRW